MLGFFRFVMNYLLNVFINLPNRLCFWRAIPAGHSPSQPPPSSAIQLPNNASIAAAAIHPEDRPIILEDVQYRPDPMDYHMRMQWPLLVIGVCVAAISAALQAYQISEQLPVTFHWFCLALELSFVTLLVSVYIRQGYRAAAGILEDVGIFFGSMAFMAAITMNLSTPFMLISLAVYLISILIIIVANLSHVHRKTFFIKFVKCSSTVTFSLSSSKIPNLGASRIRKNLKTLSFFRLDSGSPLSFFKTRYTVVQVCYPWKDIDQFSRILLIILPI